MVRAAACTLALKAVLAPPLLLLLLLLLEMLPACCLIPKVSWVKGPEYALILPEPALPLILLLMLDLGVVPGPPDGLLLMPLLLLLLSSAI
jgi:hypothetical protein